VIKILALCPLKNCKNREAVRDIVEVVEDVVVIVGGVVEVVGNVVEVLKM
jgi:signal-transduction protein with cAMP-binding, CBS, and nucleotidyltransferase domain